MIYVIVIFQKAQSSISTVFGQFSYSSSFLQYMHPPGVKTKSHYRVSTSAFFLARACVCSKQNTIMAEVERLLRDLSEKFDTLREDVDSLKEHAGKKKKSKRSHRHHTRSRTRSRSRSKSTRRLSSSLRERKSRRDSPSRSRSFSSSPQRRPRGYPDDRRSSPSGAATSSRSGERTQSGSNAVPTVRERTLLLPRAWDKAPVDETPDYNELLT